MPTLTEDLTMGATRVAVAADLQLQPTTWAAHPSLSGDTYCSLRQIVDYCVAQVMALILLGDIFDKAYPDPRSVNFFCEQMVRMRAANLDVLYIQGNHDVSKLAAHADVDTWPAVAGWPKHIHERCIRIGAHKLYGLDYTAASDLAAALGKIPASAAVLLAHQSWAELQQVGRTDGRLNMLPRTVGWLLTGDLHKHIIVQGRNAGDYPVEAVSPGSTAMQDLAESEYKFFFVVDFSSPGGPEFFPIPLMTRPLYHRRLTTVEELEHCLPTMAHFVVQPRSDLPEEIRRPIVHVKYDETIPNAFARLQAVVGSAHFFPAPFRQAPSVTVVDIGSTGGALDDLNSAVIELASSPAVRGDASRLLTAAERGGLAAEIKKIEDEAAAAWSLPQEVAT